MQPLSLEVIKAWNVRPTPVVQGARGLDQNVTVIFIHRATVDVLDRRKMESATAHFLLKKPNPPVIAIWSSLHHTLRRTLVVSTCCASYSHTCQQGASNTRGSQVHSHRM